MSSNSFVIETDDPQLRSKSILPTFGTPAVNNASPFSPEVWLVPLHGHSRRHCGVAVKIEKGWYFNTADAGAVYNNKTPAWLIRLVLGPHDARLRQFMRTHPEVVISNSHMFPEWFENKVWQ